MLKSFHASEWAISGEIVSGLPHFLSETPPNWRFIVLSGMSSNIRSIRKIIAYGNLTKIAGVYRVPDAFKAELCEILNVRLYFDDKPNQFGDFHEKGIPCVQISTEGYANRHPQASLYYNNWHEVVADMVKVISLVER